ncbi:MAG: HesA/MoeB/ThiF family protein [Pseudomonadota bacterium]
MSRYERQVILPEIGPSGQKALGRAHAVVVGAGGLGAPVIQYLAGAGVRALTIVDPDYVDESNLHRQTIFQESDIGEPKAYAAANFAVSLNSKVSPGPIMEAINPDNVEMLIEDTDVVLDCADSFAASYILSDTCHVLKKPLISASALRFSGYAGGFCGGAPSLRAVFPDLPQSTETCATAGVSGPVVGVLGSLQAQMALAVLLGMEPSPLGRLITFDAATYAFGGFRFDDAPEPQGRRFTFVSAGDISPHDFVAELRPETEAPTPAALHAKRLNAANFTKAGPRPANGQRAVMCCRSGLRAWAAAENLSRHWDGEIALVAMGDTGDNQ